MTLWLFGLWAVFGALFIAQAVTRGRASVLNRNVRLGPLEHPLRWFVVALGWWHKLVVLCLLVAIGYGCVVDSTTRLIVSVTITAMAIVTILWRRRQKSDPGAAA